MFVFMLVKIYGLVPENKSKNYGQYKLCELYTNSSWHLFWEEWVKWNYIAWKNLECTQVFIYNI
jgi:hypothetical protein